MKQVKRTKIHQRFLKAPRGILVSTDVVARGIDIPDVDVVLQVDPPKKIDFFVHRVGRTARMGKSGSAIVLLREHELDYLRLLQLRKVPISKEISIQFKDRLFSTKNESTKSKDTETVEEQEVKALSLKLQELILSDRLLFDSANKAFVCFMKAYQNHECRYMFRLSLLNAGQIANGMGLLHFPKMKDIKLSGIESFVKRENVDYDKIAYKDKGREAVRQQILKKRKEWKAGREVREKERARKKEEEERQKALDAPRREAQLKRFENQKKRKWNRYSQKIDAEGMPLQKKKRKLPKLLKERLELMEEETLLKKLKRGDITQE